MPGDANLTVRIPSELKHKATLEAVRDNRTVAQVVIVALKKYLEGK